MILVAVAVIALLPSAAVAGDDAGAMPFIYGLLGAAPVLLPLAAVLLKLGHDRGKYAAEFASLREDQDKLERQVVALQAENIVAGQARARLEGLLVGLQDHYRVVERTSDEAHGRATRAVAELRVDLSGNYVHKEHLILRLAAVEAKIEADIARRSNHDRAQLKGHPEHG